MAEKFGKTWWGNAWLQALSHIDFANRLERGARYARNGSVVNLKIIKNKVEAKVQGTMFTPYNVQVEIPKFSIAETNQLIDALSQQPAIISNLLDRKLDPEILTIAKQCNIKIFPSRWDDLKMKCSCPDFAVPCKHLAAVIYLLSREIDNNPFIIFEMHGLDLLDELSKRGIKTLEAKTVAEIPSYDQLYQLTPNNNQFIEPPAFKRIDFSQLENHADILMRLLPDKPTFATKESFKDDFAAQIKKIGKEAQKLLDGKIDIQKTFKNKTKKNITVEDQLKIIVGRTDVESYISLLLAINQDFLPDYEITVVANHQALMAAIHLLANACVAPKIVKNNDNNYEIKWFAAEIVPQAKIILEKLSEITIDYVVVFLKDDNNFISLNPAQVLVSFYLTELIKIFANHYLESDLMGMFFRGRAFSFDTIGAKEIPGAIKSWTDHLFGAQGRFQPVFSIEEDEKNQNFNLNLSVNDREKSEFSPISLKDVLTKEEYSKDRFGILRPFSMLSLLMPEVNKYINNGANKPIKYDYESFVPFLLEVIPTVKMLDIKVFMPKSLTYISRPKPTLKISRKDDSKSMFGLSDLLSFSWEVAIGNQVVSIDEFENLLRQNSSLLKFKGQFVYTSPEDIKRLYNSLTKNEKISDGRLLQAVLSGEYESAPILLSDDVKALINKMKEQENIPLPATLKATLRPYQERGYSWLYRNMRIGFGSILADDMGLGKTLQTIALLLKLKEEGALTEKRVLVVVPTGLLSNWQAEIDRFAPELSTEIYHGNSRKLTDFNSDILLTTYGMVRKDLTKLKNLSWRIMVIDEAQNIKNYATQQSKAIFSIPADNHIALSGTPVENRLSEFWSIMNYANCGYLDTIKDFNKQFANPIQQFGNQACAERFRSITAPFMMRRMKTDKSIISDLPDKVEQNDYINLLPSQAALYQSTLDEAMKTIKSIPTDDAKQLFKREGLILQMILALKQICNHPTQYLKNGDYRAELSGKTETLLDTVESIVESGEKVLIFTQFKEMGGMLKKFIEQRIGRQPLFYHGGCSVKQRGEMVEKFQTSRHDRVFILSLKAAGTGLNLTAASHVIHYDLWWNPAVEAQATDRAYRIGQNKNVIVHRFITRNTFEERIDKMIEQKRQLADLTVATGESWIGKLSNRELEEIFGGK